ncbi:isoleucine--tRNA ligase, partial [Novosphingobium sp. PASSN1]|uniref:isoleucine--tRNA ligase n=1 Tax=Novosphingobium sp. PASSN1 TaxID=2015561 RepID=UPI000BD7C228
PIEWKVEEEYRKKKKNKDEVPPVEFRAECRAYAQKWVDVQREQLKRLGINGDWDHPYLTMDPEAEGTIVGELLKFAESGQLYRGAKPVMWSPVEKTALAEAEVEYEDIVSTQIDVAFQITEAPNCPELVGAYAVIWTTTPWTIPVNQALAYGPQNEYTQIRLGERRYIVAMDLLHDFLRRVGHGDATRDENHPFWNEAQSNLTGSMSFGGAAFAGASALHPMAAKLASFAGDGSTQRDIDFFLRPRPFLPGDFVTTDSGTGLVHMAPDHGEDDFALCKAHGIEPVFAVQGDGKYREDWGWLGGQGSVINPKFNAPDGPICEALREAGGLVAASADYKHSYPHSWRSKAKVIYRCTPQWFVPMDRPVDMPHAESRAENRWDNEGGALEHPNATLRQIAVNAIAETRWVPEKGRNRIGAMVEGRPDWVLSRQRAWGVPITLFVNRKTGQYLNDPAVNARIVAAVRAGGVDAWSEERAQEYLGADYKLEDYERVTDILDVWFDSGSTHAFVLESGRWPDLLRPDGYTGPHADLYLEGSDQHRGWFQSSLLEACATRGHAPYKAVLTHGFTMDAKGMKMSKSLGNTISPIDLMKEYGADILRLWALSVDFTEDHRIGKEILAGVADQYRKLRNTFRYLLGALDGFSEDESVPAADMPELERYMLHRLAELDSALRQAIADFDFNTYTRVLIDFCNEDLSAFFFDIRKDCLYCDAPTDPKRRAYRTVLDVLFHALVRYAAPVLVFTAEEVWTTRFPDRGSVHLEALREVPAEWRDAALAERFEALRALRTTVTEAIEPLRRDKVIGSSLQAEVTVPASAPEADLAELFITASVTRGQGEEVLITATSLHKCGRCWRHLPEVAEDGALCGRCDEVVAGLEA